jgi:SSS family transporter
MTIFSSGISMYALGLLFELVLGWSFTASVLLSAFIVLIYTFLGGLSSAIYNEVLQFFLIVLGFAPLSILALHKSGGWTGVAARIPAVMTHSWAHVGQASANPMGVEIFGLVAGLGFVLSFGYWCTDFLVVQRAMAADSMSAARRTPLIAAFPKMLMPFVVILPGIAALALSRMSLGYAIPAKPGGGPDYDQVLTTLMAQFYPSGMLGVGLTALMASFMSGMAGNVTAFNTVWTYDLYQGHIRKHAPDSHYLHVARITTVAGVALSVGTAYLATHFNNIMDFLQLVFGFVNAPLFARHGPRRIRGLAIRNRGGGGGARPYAGRGQGRMAGRPAAYLSLHDGPEFLDRDLRLDYLLRGHAAGESPVKAETGGRIAKFGLRAHRCPARSGTGMVQTARDFGADCHRAAGGPQLDFLVTMTDLRASIGLFFAVIGLTLIAAGFAIGSRAPLATADVNIYGGAAMLAFGAVMLWLARRGRRGG